eukprot:4898614-Prymnesium_polylepis.1
MMTVPSSEYSLHPDGTKSTRDDAAEPERAARPASPRAFEFAMRCAHHALPCAQQHLFSSHTSRRGR